MKFKVKELMERKERTRAVCFRLGNLKFTDSGNTQLLLNIDDAESAVGQLEEYEELLEDLISAAEVSF